VPVHVLCQLGVGVWIVAEYTNGQEGTKGQTAGRPGVRLCGGGEGGGANALMVADGVRQYVLHEWYKVRQSVHNMCLAMSFGSDTAALVAQ
jgi:hypothetical protein